MKITLISKALIILIFLGTKVQAQELRTLNVSGGEAFSESGSSASFSVGQLGYVAYGDLNITVSEGVQQSAVDGESFGAPRIDEGFKISVYPNPMIDYLIIDLPSFSNTTFSVALYDIHGKLLLKKELNQQTTKIISDFLPRATYLLNILQKGEIAQTIKLIKG